MRILVWGAGAHGQGANWGDVSDGVTAKDAEEVTPDKQPARR
jgi:hypothetical protein